MSPSLKPSQTPTLAPSGKPSDEPTSVPSLSGIIASKIRLQLKGEDQINLAEVRVFDSTGADIAQGGSASMSSRLEQYYASFAIDGDVNTYAHTNIDKGKSEIYHYNTIEDMTTGSLIYSISRLQRSLVGVGP